MNHKYVNRPRGARQRGHVRRTTGKIAKWQGHYRQYQDGKIVHRSMILGLCSDMSLQDAEETLRVRVRDINEASRLLGIARQPSVVSPVFGGLMGKLNQYDKGSFAELAVTMDMMSRGFEVYRAVSNAATCDLVALGNGTTLRIQVKCVCLDRRLKLRFGTFDVLAVVGGDGSITYSSHDGSVKTPDSIVHNCSRKQDNEPIAGNGCLQLIDSQ